jgi:hypothetical protein
MNEWRQAENRMTWANLIKLKSEALSLLVRLGLGVTGVGRALTVHVWRGVDGRSGGGRWESGLGPMNRRQLRLLHRVVVQKVIQLRNGTDWLVETLHHWWTVQLNICKTGEEESLSLGKMQLVPSYAPSGRRGVSVSYQVPRGLHGNTTAFDLFILPDPCTSTLNHNNRWK